MEPYLTPCGTFRVELACWEARASQWVCNGDVFYAPTGEKLESFGENTDVQASSDGPGRLVLELRTWPDGASVSRMILDANDGTVQWVEDGKESEKRPYEALRAVMPATPTEGIRGDSSEEGTTSNVEPSTAQTSDPASAPITESGSPVETKTARRANPIIEFGALGVFIAIALVAGWGVDRLFAWIGVSRWLSLPLGISTGVGLLPFAGVAWLIFIGRNYRG